MKEINIEGLIINDKMLSVIKEWQTNTFLTDSYIDNLNSVVDRLLEDAQANDVDAKSILNKIYSLRLIVHDMKVIING